MSLATEPLVSVVIPAYRAAGSIGNCLASLCAQREPPTFEVLVVDSSPDDSTRRTIRAFERPQGGGLDLQVLSSPERLYPGTARNLGVRHARAARLLFLDADCVAHPELLSRAVATPLHALAFPADAIQTPLEWIRRPAWFDRAQDRLLEDPKPPLRTPLGSDAKLRTRLVRYAPFGLIEYAVAKIFRD